ncbi:MAG: SDR family NAD(P)-dependent oxidoreductase [Pseudomonadota bacterium]
MSKTDTAESVVEGLDLGGKTILITGVNSGLGMESMRVLTDCGATVIGAARTLEKAGNACREVGGDTTPLACELSDLSSVAAAADRVLAEHDTLDVLLCNAGIMALPELNQAHGLELQFLCNHIGHFLLINKLLPLLRNAEQGRIVLVSSDAHKLTVKGGIDFDNLTGEQGYNDWKFYGQSKLANILTAVALKKELAGTNITSNALHPGVIKTNLSRNMVGLLSKVIGLLAGFVEKTVEQGAATQVYLAAHPDAAQYNGKYFADVELTAPTKFAEDEVLAQRLWDVSNEIIADYLK